MRTMLLSFRADVFERVVSGEKIYEHRKYFPDEPIEAYLYVSAPIKAIKGIMHLNNRIEIESWKQKYSYDKETLKRIDEYLKHYKYAMEISGFQNTIEIPLQKLRDDLPNFIVPQMYYYIDDSFLLGYLRNNLKNEGNPVTNSFRDVASSQICKL